MEASGFLQVSVPLSPALCASVRDILLSTDQNPRWSRRAVERLAELRQDLSRCCNDGSVIARRGQSLELWTFAGLAANQTIVQYLQHHFQSPIRADNFWISLPSDTPIDKLNQIIQELRDVNSPPAWELQQPAADLLKFGDLLPDHLLRDLIMARLCDVPRALKILHSPICIIDF